MDALFNKGAHPRPSLFEESSAHLKITKPSGNQRNQNNQRGQGNNFQKPSRKPDISNETKLFDLCRPKWTWVRKFCLLSCLCLLSRWFLVVFVLTSLVVLLFGFPAGFSCFQAFALHVQAFAWKQVDTQFHV